MHYYDKQNPVTYYHDRLITFWSQIATKPRGSNKKLIALNKEFKQLRLLL